MIEICAKIIFYSNLWYCGTDSRFLAFAPVTQFIWIYMHIWKILDLWLNFFDDPILPCDWGCLGFPWTIKSSCHNNVNSNMTKSYEFSTIVTLQYMERAKNCKNICKIKSNFWGTFWRKSLNVTNFVRWSWNTIRNLQVSSSFD